MKSLTPILITLALAPALMAEDLGQLLFEDKFERSEAQEKTDEPGNGWGTNSKTRAKGNKQVDLRDGAMRIFIHAEANHAVSVTHPAEFADGAVSLRFLLEDAQDSLGLNFADLEFKGVHAGHLCVANVSPKHVNIRDLKTGSMRLDISEARQAKQKLTAGQQAALKGKDGTFPHTLATGQWHDLLVKITGETLTVVLNGSEAGSLTSPGIGHPVKRTLRLSVPRNVVVDDVRIWRKK